MLYFCCFQKKKEINKDKYKDIRLERIKIFSWEQKALTIYNNNKII